MRRRKKIKKNLSPKNGRNTHTLPKKIDRKIQKAVDKIVKEYGDVLKKLGDE